MAHHRLVVDHSERGASLLELIHGCGAFAVEMNRLQTGDYLIDDSILVERKAYVDFIASLIDGRLFSQVARLAHSRYRSLLLIEGPVPLEVPDVHPHSLQGALVSIAAMWRLPGLYLKQNRSGYDDSLQRIRLRRLGELAHVLLEGRG